MQQDHRSALEDPANPALVRSELRDGLRVPVQRVAHVELLSVTNPGYEAGRVLDGRAAVGQAVARLYVPRCRGSSRYHQPERPERSRGRTTPPRPRPDHRARPTHRGRDHLVHLPPAAAAQPSRPAITPAKPSPNPEPDLPPEVLA